MNVPVAGQVTFTVTSDDGFIFGVGNGATRVSGPQTNTPTNATFQNYPVMGGVNQREAPAATTITVNFPTAGVYPYELDYAKGGDNQLTLTLQANGPMIPAAALLTLTPNTVPSTTVGGVQQFTLSATDADGVVLANLPVTFTVTGVNQQSRFLTTDGVGQIGFAYVGEPQVGADTVQAAAHVNGADVYSNAVAVQWNNGVNQAPVVNAGTPQSIPSTTVGGVQQFTLSATDADGVVLANLPVTFTVTGVNQQSRFLTTDGVGQIGFAYAGEPLLGADIVKAAAHVNGADVYSNAIVVQWNNGVNQAPVVSAGTPQSIVLPNPAILNGTVSDDGLPSNALTITWGMLTVQEHIELRVRPV